MKNLTCIIAIVLAGLFFSCMHTSNKTAVKIFADNSMLDSIKMHADSIYSKRYPRTDFAKAEYYINTKDTSSTQVMKDSQDMIRQIIVVKNDIKIYFAQYYANGQLMAKYNLDSYGQYHGSSKEFDENGLLKREGSYVSGLHSGKWKNYDEQGNIISTDEYNKDGQQINRQ